MSLLDDILRVFGTSRIRVQWQWKRFREGARRATKRVTTRVTVSQPAFEHQLCASCGHPAGRDERVCSRCGVRLRGAILGKLSKALGALVPEGVPIASMVFLAACLGLYVITLKASYATSADAEGTSPSSLTLLRYGANHPYWTITAEQWWRLVTATFLHGSVLHIGMNAFAMWTAGGVIEERFGRARTIVLMFVAGVAGSALSVCWRLHAEAPPWGVAIGASTAGFGQLGFVLGHAFRRRGRTAAELRARFVPWLISGLIMTFAVPNIDAPGHLGGLAAGALLGVFVADRGTARRAPAALWNLLAVLVVLAVIAAFVCAAQYRIPDHLLQGG